jgi:hypothetical protein
MLSIRHSNPEVSAGLGAVQQQELRYYTFKT